MDAHITRTFHLTISELEANELIEEFDAVRELCITSGRDNLPEQMRTLEELICSCFNV